MPAYMSGSSEVPILLSYLFCKRRLTAQSCGLRHVAVSVFFAPFNGNYRLGSHYNLNDTTPHDDGQQLNDTRRYARHQIQSPGESAAISLDVERKGHRQSPLPSSRSETRAPAWREPSVTCWREFSCALDSFSMTRRCCTVSRRWSPCCRVVGTRVVPGSLSACWRRRPFTSRTHGRAHDPQGASCQRFDPSRCDSRSSHRTPRL